MKRYLTIGFLLVGCSSSPAYVEQIDAVESKLLRTFTIRGEPVITSTLEERMEELNVPGVSVAVLHDGEIAWARGYGFADVDAQRRVTANTLFQAASISKPIAGTSALKLVDAGRVHLDSNVNNYLSSWQVPDNQFTVDAKVTLRGILTHRAGLTVWGFPGYGPNDRVPATVEVLDGRGNTDPVRVYKVPDESWRYSGGGYTVMQQLVEDVYERPFADVMRIEVLEPIGMLRSTYEQPLPPERWDEAATGYRAGKQPVDGKWHTYPERAAAGLWTTPSELAMYVLEVQRSYRGESNSVLSQSMVHQMLEDHGGHGLGPAIQQDGERFGHGGSNEGFRSTFTAFISDDEGVFVMTNSDNGSRLASEIAITVADAYGWSGPLAQERVPVDLAATALERLVGTYVEPEVGAEFTVTVADRGLRLAWDADSAALWPMTDSTFFDPEDGQAVSFTTEDGDLSIVLGNLRAVMRRN